MGTEAQLDIDRYGFNPDNFHEVFQCIGIHSTKLHRTGCLVYFLLPTIQPTTKVGYMC